MATTPLIVVFSDLDGSLLDHHSYSFDEAAGALRLLEREGIPLVPCSSKTRAEIELVQAEIGTDHPIISENGGGIFVPAGYFPFAIGATRLAGGYEVIDYGRPYAHVVAALRETAARVRIEVVGFADMSVDEVAAACGLPLVRARLAKLREYDEPFRIVDSSPQTRSRLLLALRASGVRCLRGGRYEHAGTASDKGACVARLRRLYERAHGRVVTVGVGDGFNDLGLLKAVDVPIIVENPSAGAAARLLRKVPTARLTSGSGPAGWASSVIQTVTALLRTGTAQPSLATLS